MIVENSTKLQIKLPKGDVHAKMQTFYNPQMESNRNISILLLNSIEKAHKIALPLAGSGIRGIRFIKELKNHSEIYLNDHKPSFPEQLKSTLKLNKIPLKKAKISTKDASLFLLNQGGFDYIDLDPFGSPNPFLAAAIARISRDGFLAVTATDTAALTGTYARATQRKYWAKSYKNYMMHETGLRILIRKIQLQAVQFDIALKPILCYHKDHYFRCYLQVTKGKSACDQILKNHLYFLPEKMESNNQNCTKQWCGPLWTGPLIEPKIIKKMQKINPFPKEQKFLDILAEESAMPKMGFYDIHALAKKYSFEPCKLVPLLKAAKGVRTHFSPNGIKTALTEKKLVSIIRAHNGP